MSNTGKYQDRAPFLKVAGITSTVFGNSADQSLRQDLYYQVNKNRDKNKNIIFKLLILINQNLFKKSQELQHPKK